MSYEDPDDLRVGSIIAGRYRLEKVLGEGGMGAVYEATQLALNREVAIKVMHPSVGTAPDAKARFEREARVSGALHHPNAVKIFDFGEDEHKRLYLVMEKLRGTTLRSFVAASLPPMPLARTVNVSLQLADVLVAAHAMGLVHRDLKPENIFLEQHQDGSDRVVVVDFGLAFIEEREDATRMTQAGMIMGTPLYMSPEQCAGGADVGPPTDIYAFGCMLYEMVTSSVPFDGPTIPLLGKHVFEVPEAPSRRRADVYIPRVLEDLILDMMAKKPNERPIAKDVGAVLGQLEHTLGERERARGREFLEGREARMIPTVRSASERAPAKIAPPGGLATVPPPRRARAHAQAIADGAAIVAVLGPELPSDLVLAVRANGYALIGCEEGELPEGACAIFAPGAEAPTLHRLVALGLPVVTDTATTDEMARVSSLLSLGVADVVTQPLRPEKLATKLARALKKHRRKAGA